MKRVFLLFAYCLLCLCCIGCGKREASRTLLALDTVAELRAYGKNAETVLSESEAELRSLEALLSVTDETGDIHRLNAANGAGIAVDGITVELLEDAIRYSELTGGAFDPTVYPLVQLWGFGETPAVPDASSIGMVLENVGVQNIRIDGTAVSLEDGAGIDLGGIAKGLISDRLAALIKDRGIGHAFLSLGGNVRVIGTKPDGSAWRIGVQDPLDGEQVIGVIEAVDTSIITSGSYQRYFEESGVRYHHILDPKTGYPSKSDLISVTIICENGTMADAFSTALFVMGSEEAIAFWRENGGFEWVMILHDGTVLCSEQSGFSAIGERRVERIAR